MAIENQSSRPNVVGPIDEKSYSVGIDSALKFGATVSGAHRQQRNFDRIIPSLSSVLHGKGA